MWIKSQDTIKGANNIEEPAREKKNDSWTQVGAKLQSRDNISEKNNSCEKLVSTLFFTMFFFLFLFLQILGRVDEEKKEETLQFTHGQKCNLNNLSNYNLRH